MAKLSSVWNLPREIINHIINQTEYLQTLKNWALVDRATNAIAEQILWRDIVVNDNNIANDEEPPNGIPDHLNTTYKEGISDTEWVHALPL